MLLKLTINKLKKVVKTQSHQNVGLLAVKWSKLVILETRLNSCRSNYCESFSVVSEMTGSGRLDYPKKITHKGSDYSRK